jgi:hypothetical protein
LTVRVLVVSGTRRAVGVWQGLAPGIDLGAMAEQVGAPTLGVRDHRLEALRLRLE